MRCLPLSLFRLARFLRRWRFDILHCHLSLADVLGRIAGAIARVPVIVTTEHGKHLWKSRPHIWLERVLERSTDLRICVSRDIVEIRRRREGTSERKLVYIPNGVDPGAVRGARRERASVMAEFGWGPRDPLVLAVGRLVPAKSYATLVEAASILRRTIPNARCLIVGEGRHRAAAAAAIERFGSRGDVVLAGSRTDIPDLLAAADLFVLTSIREGLPVSLLEAMAARKAIVATSVGGVPDAVTNGESGVLIPPGDPAAAASAMARLIADPALRRTLGAAAARVVEERFTVQSMVRQVGAIYEDLLVRKRRQSA